MAFTGIWASSQNNIFTVEDTGVIHQFDGNRWKATEHGLNTTFYDIHGTGLLVYAVTTNGLMVEHDGLSWTTVQNIPIPNERRPFKNYTSINCSSESRIAVGLNGLAIHYNAGSWTPKATKTEDHLYDVWTNRHGIAFAVGYKGTVIRYDGEDWRDISPGNTAARLNSVWANQTNDVFVVGEKGTILRFDGCRWHDMSVRWLQDDLLSVCGAGHGNVYAVGERGIVLHYNGHAWGVLPLDTKADLVSVCTTDENEVFILSKAGEIYYSNKKEGWTRLDLSIADNTVDNKSDLVDNNKTGIPEITTMKDDTMNESSDNKNTTLDRAIASGAGAFRHYRDGAVDSAAAVAARTIAARLAAKLKLEANLSKAGLEASVPIIAAALGGAFDLPALELGGMRAAHAMGTLHGTAVLEPVREFLEEMFSELVEAGSTDEE